MDFLLNGKSFFAEGGDLVIWQMSSEVSEVIYTPDFRADFLLVSSDFLGRFNPEMAWAVRGFVFIKLHPAFRLSEKGRVLCEEDFGLIRHRLKEEHLFGFEVVGRALQIFLFDLWEIYSQEISAMKTSDTTASTFFRFLELAQKTQQHRARSVFLCRQAVHHAQISIGTLP